jgi:hypothetical protein
MVLGALFFQNTNSIYIYLAFLCLEITKKDGFMKKRQGGKDSFLIWSLVFIFILVASAVQANAKIVKYKGKKFDIAEPGDFIPKQIVIVEKKKEKAQTIVYDLANELSATVLHENKTMHMYLLEFLDDKSVRKALRKIARKKNPPYTAFRNWKVSIPNPPVKPIKRPVSKEVSSTIVQHWTNDPAFKTQWWLWKIKEPFTSNPATGNVKNIAIIDTGVDYNHSDLSGKVNLGFDYVDWDWDPMDENGHGTHCAGIAAALSNNGIGIHGVSPESKIWAYRVLNREGSGGSFQVMAAITDAADNPNVDIISCSFGAYYILGSPDYLAYRDVINYARKTRGKIVCAASGNDYNYDLYYYAYFFPASKYVPCPAFFPKSFTVGASDINDCRAAFSNSDVINLKSGDASTTYDWNFIDIVAPGVNILSTLPRDCYAEWSGTSMATPMVAGACARVWSQYPSKSPNEIESLLKNSGKGLGKSYGFQRYEKRLDLMKALGMSKTGFQGQVIHGEKGYPVNGAKVEVNLSGAVVKTAWTNNYGVWTANGLNHTLGYQIRVSKAGYVTSQSWVGKPGTSGSIKDLKGPFLLLPKRGSTGSFENWRIVVSWPSISPGEEESAFGYILGYSSTFWPYYWYESAGLEANAYLKSPSGATYYYDEAGALGTAPFVRYMHDSYWHDDYPFEGFVIQDQEAGTYKFWIVCEDINLGWGQMKYGAGDYPSYPIAYIYKGNTLKMKIKCKDATRNGSGTKYWKVCTINGDVVTRINVITNIWPGT